MTQQLPTLDEIREQAENAANVARSHVAEAMRQRQERAEQQDLFEDMPTLRQVIAAWAVPVVAVAGIITGIVVWRRRRARRVSE